MTGAGVFCRASRGALRDAGGVDTAFADRWIALWNAHDVVGVCALFADEIVFRSHTAAVVVPESNGVIVGKAALEHYWHRAVERNESLQFELVTAYSCLGNLMVICYRNQRHEDRVEVLRFAGVLVVEGWAGRSK